MAKQLAEQKQRPNQILTIDAKDCIAGRMCSHISKLLLQGHHVRVVNAEKSMISGNRYKTIEEYKEYLTISSATNPIHGPFHPRKPDRILTRMVRGMLPKRKSSGLIALKRLRIYVAIPPDLKNAKLETFEDSKIRKPSSYFITLGEVAKQIGWKGLDSYE
ncbi:MAG TPA: 50S ribosomal protein L13 [Nitrososphaeraceae archaeon]|nr:50S ribosomal protein L13 [Nitrososphaeraceae archaeon]